MANASILHIMDHEQPQHSGQPANGRERMATMIGARLGPWIIDEELGRGGMGAVYRAHRAMDAPAGPLTAAVKVLAGELAVEEGFQQRFQREIDILRKLEHPNIVRLYDSAHQDDRFWYAMELVNGPSYESLRDEQGRVPWPDVLEMALQVSPALKHAHDRGVIHRDLKPANLLRAWSPGSADASPIVKLTDFGIASLFASPHLTVTGGIIGTPEYLSPEQAAGKPVTKRSDLYSLGISLYTLITGTTPFTGSPIDLLHKHRYAQFEMPSRIIPDLPPDFEQIICELLDKIPEMRPGDAGVLYRRLEALRKKLARQVAGETDNPVASERTTSESGKGREGPATFVSRVVRQELERQNRGGPIQQFFNHPAVLVTLFALCVGTLTYVFWPLSAETLYLRGSRLMASDNPDDRDRAWEKYLGPLTQRHPDHPFQDEVAQMKQQYDEELAARKAARGTNRPADRVSEGQWFFEKGLRQHRQGDIAGASKTWRALIDAYGEVPVERPWVRKAQERLGKGEVPDGKDLAVVRAALLRAEAFARDGKHEEAERVRQGLRELYRDDPPALRLIDGK